MQKFDLLYSQEKIADRIRKLGELISEDYENKNPILIGVLKGCIIFMADLIRQITVPLDVDFMAISYYGGEDSSLVKITKDIDLNVAGRPVIMVEDIVDTGLTVSFLLDHLKQKEPASLRLCALVDKPSRRKVQVHIDYLGFTIPNKFIVGYGIDWNDKFRYLPDICALEEN